MSEEGSKGPAGHSSTPSKLAANISSLASSEIMVRVLGFIGAGYIGRRLGPEGFGTVGLATAIVGYFSIAVSGGFNEVGAREVSRKPADAFNLCASVTALKLLFAVGAFALLAIATWWFGKSHEVKLVVLLSGLYLFTLALDPGWVYKGLEKNFQAGMALSLGQLLFVAGLFIFVHGPADVYWVPIAQFAGGVVSTLLLLLPLLIGRNVKLELGKGLHIFAASANIAVSRSLRTIIYTFDTLMLGFIWGETTVGLYNAPYRICYIFVAIAGTIQMSYLPSVARAHEAGLEAVGALARRSLWLAMTVAIPMVVGGAVLAPRILTFIFGGAYAPGATALAILLVSIAFIFMHKMYHNVILAYGRLNREMWIMLAAAALNVALNVALIPAYGLAAAAINTAIAEGLVLVCSILLSRKIGITINMTFALRLLAAAALMGLILLLMIPLGSFTLSITSGCVVYFIGLLIFKGFPPDAADYGRSLLTRMRAPRQSAGKSGDF